MKKLLKIMSGTTTFLLFAALLFMIVVVISSKASGGNPSLMGYEIKSVLSGSMEPTFQTGSVIAIEPTEDGTGYQEGDVITFQQEEDVLVTHRITDVNESSDQVMYETKGDNNDAVDMEPVLSDNVIGKYADFTIPYLGYLIDFANSPTGALVLLVVPGVIVFLYGIFAVWRELRKLEGKSKKDTASESSNLSD
ncbi:signal peptidase I [Salibacterium salarium]|uniref:Signal peptidase I n=1 Tax=Salibacterium salarium TaxID=284579 RepID=A0A3R9QH05_9BACI|nr:signal peptidase I [Salibacterium salarium]RSL30307.1 signal peptidase I [Salibacterium salarium]